MQVVPHRTPEASRADIASIGAAGVTLLETKLYVPRVRSGLVARSRLVERMREGGDRKLTLVTAPAGSGKTTLLAEWLAHPTNTGRSTGWVSLDASENDPALFWSYFVRALQKAHPGLGARAFTTLHSTQPSMESVLTALINEIDAVEADVVLVLDDYHAIESAPIHDALTFLLDHLPSRMHVVIASRSEPPLPLARMRARGELNEVDAADLRFTSGEASTFLNDVMALDLSATDVSKLESRTEGWITGLKLAALSLKSRVDANASLDGFSGDQRYIAEYLVDEVLRGESERVRRFLLRTSILDRLSGSLCDAVTEQPDSQLLLESLFKRNLFVVALDDRREWYRYHHLFADVLAAHASREDATAVRYAHRRASVWYERQGIRSDAVRHAFAGGDAERAASLLETEWPPRDRSFEAGNWLARVRQLPDPLVRARPVLSMAYAWALLNGGEVEAAPPRLDDVERWLVGFADREAAAAAGMVVVDETRFASLRAELASARVYLAQTVGDTYATVEHARRALELVTDEDIGGRATGTALLALALWANGELEPAYRSFSDALDWMRKMGATRDVIRGIFVLGDIRVAQGRLREAASIYEGGLRAAAEEVPSGDAETDELYLGLAEVHREWGEIDTAAHLLESMAASDSGSRYRGNKPRWCTAFASVCEARGDLERARALLEEAGTGVRRDPIPRARPLAALKARLSIRLGRLDEAERWARGWQTSAAETPGYLGEFEQITFVRLLLARAEAGDEGAASEASRTVERLLPFAEAGGRTGSAIELLVLQARALQLTDKGRRALEPLGRALELARAERHARVFLDEGDSMRDLLRQAVARGVEPDLAGRLLLAFEPVSARAVATAASAPGDGAVHALTPREHAILRLIASGMRNQQIADQLSISPATVKRHVANVYLKLGVGHRTEALVRARELGLL